MQFNSTLHGFVKDKWDFLKQFSKDKYKHFLFINFSRR